MLETKTLELDTKTKELDKQTIALNLAKDELNAKEQALIIIQTDLDKLQDTLSAREEELENAKAALIIKQQDLDEATARLEEQQLLLASQASRIDDLIGIRTTMIRELTSSLNAASLKAAVDPNTGDIVLDSSVFFETGKSEIKEEGRNLLERFIPVYLNVLLQDKYAGYLGEIIIEGHTDSSGSYESNLKLSQNRALQVALYCLNMRTLTGEQKLKLQEILTAKGRSYSDLVRNADGSENADASRRVEFKFSLKDAEMIEELNRILSDSDTAETTP
jgi:chemotaxis protein MotB